jgi:hypothetical protein
MKVPTYRKYGLSKRKFDSVNDRNRKVSHLLAHDIPFVLGIAIGIALWIYTYKRLNPTGVLETASQIFLFGTIGLICVGIPMLIFKSVEKLYHYYMRKNSPEYISAKMYEDDREVFSRWKIRRDENYWRLLDGLSFEKEMLKVFSKTGYEVKSEVSQGSSFNAYAVSKDGKDILLLCWTGKSQLEFSTVEQVLVENKNRFNEAMLVSSSSFTSELVKKSGNYPLKLITLKDLVELARTIPE